MLRSLFAGVSGLRSHQQMLDVVGNNIANTNTTGFKSSSVVFQDLLSQVLQGATSTTAAQGGTNPAQIGLGARVAAVTTNFAQGALQTTGNAKDLAIQGDGFFVVAQQGQQMYTRAGNFEFDAQGNFVTESGAFIQGWMADENGTINADGALEAIKLQVGQLADPVKTNNITIGNMLSANAAVGAVSTTQSTVIDTQGNPQQLTMTFTKTGANAWSIDTTDAAGTSLGTAAITFDPATGLLNSQTPANYTVSPTPAGNWPTPITIGFGVAGDAKALKEFGGTSTAEAISQDGIATGTLQSFKVGSDGTVTGVFSNGTTKAVGRLAMANFNNPGGLEKAGGSFYRQTPNSGVAQISEAGTNGLGSLASGTLEMSNVDLSQEFTNLIIAQRGFQANSKVITTSDEILQELLSLKR